MGGGCLCLQCYPPRSLTLLRSEMTPHLRLQRLEEATFPFIVFHSENDTMVDVDGSKALFLRAKVGTPPPASCVL